MHLLFINSFSELLADNTPFLRETGWKRWGMPNYTRIGLHKVKYLYQIVINMYSESQETGKTLSDCSQVMEALSWFGHGVQPIVLGTLSKLINHKWRKVPSAMIHDSIPTPDWQQLNLLTRQWSQAHCQCKQRGIIREQNKRQPTQAEFWMFFKKLGELYLKAT